MEVCKLCFKSDKYLEAEIDLTHSKETLNFCQTFVSELTTCSSLIQNQWICEVCLINAEAFIKFKKSITRTEQKILDVKKFKGHKFDIKTLHPKVNALPSELKELVTICRICLKFIRRPLFFLYENNVNVVGHNMLRTMLLYCDFNLSVDISEKPTMCTNCWTLLQISYTFKKNYVEADKMINMYCQRFKLKRLLINKEIFKSININYYSKQNITCKLPNGKACGQNIKYSDSVRIKTEHNYTNPYSKICKNRAAIMSKTRSVKRAFTAEDETLMRIFYFIEITRNLRQSKNRNFWPEICEIWQLIYPDKWVSMNVLRMKCSFIKQDISESKLLVLKSEILKKVTLGYTTSEMVSWIENKKNCSESANVNRTDENCSQIQVKSFALNPSAPLHVKEKNTMEVDGSNKIFTKAKFIKVNLQNLEEVTEEITQPLTVKLSSEKECEQLQNKIDSIRKNTTSRTVEDLSFKNINNYNANKLPHKRPICVERIPPPPSIKNPSSTQETCIEKLASGIPGLPPDSEGNNSDSDDLFVDEAAPSSPFIKVELDDSDIEICIDEPKLEVQSYHSDSVSLPELERMDVASIPLENCLNSVDDKRELFNHITENIDIRDPDLDVEEIKTCRRFIFKNQPISDELFKCLHCNFETKHRGSADNHAKWHNKKSKFKRKLYECPECPYKITNKNVLAKHLKLHKEENEIPVLLPWTEEFKK